MKTRQIGSSGIEASVIGFGAWAIGGWMWGGDTDEKQAIYAIQAALDNGITLIDTAPVYGFGMSEQLVGKALQGGYRQKAVLASKCGLVWDSANGEHFFDSSPRNTLDDVKPDADYHVYRYLGAQSIRREVEASLKRMKVDVIDVMQTHWQDPTTPIEETAGELAKLKQEGKIRAIGCSNAEPSDMDQYRKVAPLDVDQEQYSMLDRGMESTNLPYCKQHDIAFFAYSPLAQGLLTGKIGPERIFSPDDQRASSPRFQPDKRQTIATFLEALRPVADKHEISFSQLVAAWTIAQPGCTHALLGARNPEQVKENAKAGSVELEPEDVAFIIDTMANNLAHFDEE